MIPSEEILEAVRPRLRHFVAMYGDEAIALLQARTAFKPETIGGWLALETPPAQPLLKVWHLLDLLGYPSPEVARLDSLQQYLGRLYAMGVVDNAKLLETLKVQNMQTAVQFMRGQPSMKLKLSNLDELRSDYDAKLNKALAALPKWVSVATLEDHEVAPAGMSTKFVAPVVKETAAAVAQKGEPVAVVAPVGGSVGVESLVPALGDPAMMLSMLLGLIFPVASRLVLECSPEERARFRALVGLPDVIMLAETVRLLDALRTRATYDEYMRGRR